MANVQKAGGVAAYVDAEHALDIDYAKKLGVNIEDLLVSQPDTGEQALEIVEILVRSGAVDIVVIDSVAALVPKAEIEGEMGDSHVGLQARLMSQALRKLTGAINRSNCAVVFINQLREKIGVMFGNPETTTGGKALKFYASLRLDIRRIGPVKERETVIGNHVRVKVVKNKVAPPFRQAEFDIMFDEGISHTSLLVDLAAEANIIQKSGAWYSYGDQRIGQGRENAKLFLRDNPALMAEVEGKVKELLGMHAPVGAGRRRGRRRVSRAASITALEPDPAPPGHAPGRGRRGPVRRGARDAGAGGRAGGRPAGGRRRCRSGSRPRRTRRPRSGRVLRALERRSLRAGDLAPPAAAEGPSAAGGGGGARAGCRARPAGRRGVRPGLRADARGARPRARAAHARSPGHGRRAAASSTARSPPSGPRAATGRGMPLGARRQAAPRSWAISRGRSSAGGSWPIWPGAGSPGGTSPSWCPSGRLNRRRAARRSHRWQAYRP